MQNNIEPYMALGSPGYAKFSRDLENEVGALGYAYHYQAVDAVGAAGDVDAPEEYVYE